MAEKLTELFHCMWRTAAIPQEFTDASIVHLYKRKGNVQVCDNHWGISLLSIAGKILAKIKLNRLNENLDRAGPILESQRAWIHEGQRNNRHDLYSEATAREMARTNCGHLHDLRRPYQSI